MVFMLDEIETVSLIQVFSWHSVATHYSATRKCDSIHLMSFYLPLLHTQTLYTITLVVFDVYHLSIDNVSFSLGFCVSFGILRQGRNKTTTTTNTHAQSHMKNIRIFACTIIL